MAAIASPIFISVLTLSLLLLSLQYSAHDENYTPEEFAKMKKFCLISGIPPYPESCERCILHIFDGAAASADEKGLAKLVVQCTSDAMGLMLDYLHTFHDPPTKTAVEYCTFPLENSGDVYVRIDRDINQNNYDDAHLDVSHILFQLKYCRSVLGHRGEEMFPALDMLVNVTTYSNTLAGILGNLAKDAGKRH